MVQSFQNERCADQVLSLTTHIEVDFQKQEKKSVVFINLTAAYDTVCKEGIQHKLIKVVPLNILE